MGKSGRCFYDFFFFFRFWVIYLDGEEERATSSCCGGVALKVVPMAARWPFQVAWSPNSVEIVSSELDCRGGGLFFFFLRYQQIIAHAGSESEVNIETHGKGEFGAAGRPDQTRRTPINPRKRDCSTDQNAPRPFHLCASPQLSQYKSCIIYRWESIFQDHIMDFLQQIHKNTAEKYNHVYIFFLFERLQRGRSSNPHLP